MALADWTFSPASGFEREFDRLRRQMNDVIGRIGLGAGGTGGIGGFPALNMYDQQDDVMVAAQVPGVPKESLNVELRENTLTITGKREPPGYADASVLREECVYGEFKRSLRMPFRIQNDGIEASYKNGILLMKMPKAEEAKPKRIAINA